MFSGIIEGKGKVTAIVKEPLPLRLTVEVPWDTQEVQCGDSVAIEGVCLTVVNRAPRALSFDVVAETLRKTTLGSLHVGSMVNVERSLALGSRLHGHFVFGHVDGKVRLVQRLSEGKDSVRCVFQYPKELSRYLVSKGSFAVAGVSLTIGEVTDDTVSCYLVPHTLEVTTLGSVPLGAQMNLEIDMLARYAVGRL